MFNDPGFNWGFAHLLGDEIRHLDIPDSKLSEVLPLDIEPFVLSKVAMINSSVPIAKALATMEDLDTTYLFVVDDGVYKGIITIMAIARSMMADT